MRTKLPVLAAVLCLSIGCAPLTGASAGISAPPAIGPSYVYVYPGGCWADDLWHAPCPWYPEPGYGYFYYYQGHYYWNPRVFWHMDVRTPPPRHWRFARPHPRHRVVYPVPRRTPPHAVPARPAPPQRR